jgi:hypothetical protein
MMEAERMAVGKRGTKPVCRYSITMGQARPRDKSESRTPQRLKKDRGLSVM